MGKAPNKANIDLNRPQWALTGPNNPHGPGCGHYSPPAWASLEIQRFSLQSSPRVASNNNGGGGASENLGAEWTMRQMLALRVQPPPKTSTTPLNMETIHTQ